MSTPSLKIWIINKNRGLIVKFWATLDGFTDFHGLMAAILDFLTFMGQILIEFFLVIFR